MASISPCTKKKAPFEARVINSWLHGVANEDDEIVPGCLVAGEVAHCSVIVVASGFCLLVRNGNKAGDGGGH